MKKLLMVLTLVVLIVSSLQQAFARELDDDEIELGRYAIPVKVGYGFNQAGAAAVNKVVERFDLENSYSFSIGYLFYSNIDSSGFGFALEYMPATEVKDSDGAVKIGLYNIYFMINPNLKSNIADTFNLYLPIHIGISVPYKEVKSEVADDVDPGMMGLYYGIGIGTTIKKSFFIELMYTFSGGFIDTYTPSKRKGDDTLFFGTNFGGLRLNVGYNFHFGKSISNKEGRFKGKE